MEELNKPDNSTGRNEPGTQAAGGKDYDKAEALAGTQGGQPLTTQGNDAEREENLGGTTNLSLEQLKKEGDPEGETPDRPDDL